MLNPKKRTQEELWGSLLARVISASAKSSADGHELRHVISLCILLDIRLPGAHIAMGGKCGNRMARLVIKSDGLADQALELRIGVNHVGRDPACDFIIDHPSVSAMHCELVVSSDGVLIHDCHSTNGTFVNGEGVKEAWLRPGQTVRLGAVTLFVENTDIAITIPQLEHEHRAPPVVLPDGVVMCARHPHMQAVYQCAHCHEIMCGSCAHVVQLRGGRPLFLCPLCSQPCEYVRPAEKPGKKPILQTLQRTIKLRLPRFLRRSKSKP